MKEFPIYRLISGPTEDPDRMQIAVLVLRTMGGQAVLRSVNRHVHSKGGQWIGNHPDFYDGVDTKNARAEEMFNGLDAELASLTRKFEALDEEISQWAEQKKFDEFAFEMAKECAESRFKLNPDSVLGLLGLVRTFAVQKLKNKQASVRAEAVNTGVKMAHAKKYLADVQRDFPRLVAYVVSGTVSNLAPKRAKKFIPSE